MGYAMATVHDARVSNTHAGRASGVPARSGRVLTDWDPEDRAFWERYGKRIAKRNLWISIPNLLLAFAVWMVWSVVVVNLPHIGFQYTTSELFWLAALPGLSGATLRAFYAFMVPIFGGRTWTTISTASLLVPAVGIGLAVQNPETSYATMLVLALLCGLGGGNFASSMAHISFFFPQREKGTALGLNGGLGNLGVSLVQFMVPVAITGAVFGAFGGGSQLWSGGDVQREVWLQNAGFIWVPFIVASAAAAWFGMHDIASTRSPLRAQTAIFKRKHAWLMSWLYTGTFGSWIGYSAGFPLLIKTQFPEVDPMHYAFLGPLVGALVRPIGGWLADKLGGATVTYWNFVIMAMAVLGLLYCLPGAESSGSFWGVFAMFMVLFITSGIGNGSTFRMIPEIFLVEKQRAVAHKGPEAQAQAPREAANEAAVALGFTSAIGAYGAFFIPSSFGASIAITQGPQGALFGFIVFYLTCIAITWWFYTRRSAEVPC
jgi:MFS transporter, NNP family, nitrate/nitrite transporter